MPIKLMLPTDDILSPDPVFGDMLVNPVNCRGIAGAGLALAFRKRYPENHIAYERQCRSVGMYPGVPFVVEHGAVLIVNLPTKDHWQDKSEMWIVKYGIENLVGVVSEHKPRAVRIPALGCGLGGLDWNKVLPLIEHAFERASANIQVYPPRN